MVCIRSATALAFVLLSATALDGAMPAVATTFQAPRVSIGGDRLLTLASNLVTPSYPAASLAARRQGLVVAQVIVGADGQIRPSDVQILQAPDEAMGASVISALAQWRFRSVATGGTPAVVRSKVFYYFTIRDGKGTALTPVEMAAALQPEAQSSGRTPERYPSMTKLQWDEASRLQNGSSILLDVQSRPAFARDHLVGAINIPENELTLRALAELPRDRQIVVDCPSRLGDLCEHVGEILRRRNYERVAMLRR